MTPDNAISVLMYHEVSDARPRAETAHHLTPSYDIAARLFDEHMSMLAQSGFRTVLPHECALLDPALKQVMITFDDGLAGNFSCAMPTLQKHGFRAIFFVAVGAVGGRHYMSWNELRQLCGIGMEVQSHTVSHRPLETLSEQDIRTELLESKNRLEQELQKPVTALSVPHGSYDSRVARIALDVGYRSLFTSEVKRNPVAEFGHELAILGRVAVTAKFSAHRVRRCAEGNYWEIRRERVAKQAKNTLKRIIGIENYRRLYRRYFNISEPMGDRE